MDPKQAMKVMGPTNDVYAFGAVMYELITRGGLPFGSFESFMNDMAGYELRKRNEAWNRELLEQMSPDATWVKVISNCLRYKAEDRYQNITEVMDALSIKLNSHEAMVPVTAASTWYLEVKKWRGNWSKIQPDCPLPQSEQAFSHRGLVQRGRPLQQ